MSSITQNLFVADTARSGPGCVLARSSGEPVNTRLTPAEKRFLAAEAKRRKTTMAQLIRDAIRKTYIGAEEA